MKLAKTMPQTIIVNKYCQKTTKTMTLVVVMNKSGSQADHNCLFIGHHKCKFA